MYNYTQVAWRKLGHGQIHGSSKHYTKGQSIKSENKISMSLNRNKLHV